MYKRVFFWLKVNLGFTINESRGFLLLIPILIGLVGATHLVAWTKNQSAQKLYQYYLFQVDSLAQRGVVLFPSPQPTFNHLDTFPSTRSTKVSARIQRLPFSESDSVVLQIVPGVGSTTAGRIIKYRERLGGFIREEQLHEVYGLKPEVILGIWEYFDFDFVPPVQLEINLLSTTELAQHPYISYQEAKVLTAYRLQHGPFHRATDLLEIKIFKMEWVEKISPYLSFEVSTKFDKTDTLLIK